MRVIASYTDVTARVLLERDLAQGQQRYRSLVDHNPDAVFALAPDGAFTAANDACATLSGYTVAELLTLSFTALLASEDLGRAADLFGRAAGGAPQRDVELGVRRKDGAARALSVTAVPIVVDGAVVGVYGIAKDVTAQRHAEAASRRQATHDALTDLPNRVLLDEHLARLTQSEAAGAPGSAEAATTAGVTALLLLDLDGFKDINDTFGHPHGDALLCQVAERLRGALRASDLVARLGGDEFAVVLAGDDGAAAARAAACIRAALDAPFVVEGRTLHIGGSIGIALHPDHGADGTTLLRHADVALYAAKRGRRGAVVYDPAGDGHSPLRLALAGELRAAVECGALALHYQPQADLASGRVRGVEALVRWPHARRGLVPPDEFIPLAERTGLIGPLTRWVLATALRQWRAWRRDGLLLTMSVNLSVWDLHDEALPDLIAGLLREHGVPPAWLRLELTEGTLMADPDRALAVLGRLRGLGVGLAVDDFGAGYSSLAYLKRLPVDELKIDRSFVRALATDERDAAIVASTVELGHALGLRVVAEGIEDAASWERLVALGCDTAQGYHLSRPLTADAFARWFRESPWAVA